MESLLNEEDIEDNRDENTDRRPDGVNKNNLSPRENWREGNRNYNRDNHNHNKTGNNYNRGNHDQTEPGNNYNRNRYKGQLARNTTKPSFKLTWSTKSRPIIQKETKKLERSQCWGAVKLRKTKGK